MKTKRSSNLIYFIMVLPAMVYVFIFCYLPMPGAYMAFTDYSFTGGVFGSRFVGLMNFKILNISGDLLRLTINTIVYNIIFIFLGNFLQMLVAIIISELPGRQFKKITQTIMFLPYFVSFVLVGAFIYNIFNYEHGVLNSLLKSLSREPFNAYSNTIIWPLLIVFFNMWKSIGLGSLIYFAVIMGISGEFYESSRIDGASIFQQIRYITIPLLVPTFTILVLLSLGNILRGQFDLFYNIVGRANIDILQVTDVIDTYVYRMTVAGINFNLGAAVGIYQSFIGFFILLTANKFIKHVAPDNALF